MSRCDASIKAVLIDSFCQAFAASELRLELASLTPTSHFAVRLSPPLAGEEGNNADGRSGGLPMSGQSGNLLKADKGSQEQSSMEVETEKPPRRQVTPRGIAAEQSQQDSNATFIE